MKGEVFMENFFATNLKFLRDRHNITQSELAKKMNKDYSTIGKWELNQRTPIMADMMKLADFFNITVQDLVSKDLRIKNDDNTFDELELLFQKHKDILTTSDKEHIRFIIEQRKKDIDKQLGEDFD